MNDSSFWSGVFAAGAIIIGLAIIATLLVTS